MPLTREKKESIVKEIEDCLTKQKSIVFMDFKGIKVKDLSVLRNQLKEQDGEMKVSKKSLINVAFKNKNFDFDAKNLSGEVAVIFGYGDEVSSSKAVYQFTKTSKEAKILGGFVENKFYSDIDIIRLAELPPKPQMIGMFMATINAPVTNFVGVLGGNLRKVVVAFSEIKNKKTA
ncbi:MAG: 50S ribosomal protein L10 [Candidatus Paceibacterota bacterium]|jgi:large subunit ribosomal protein L10|nr:50S ribosomal protein L10 [bacterium]